MGIRTGFVAILLGLTVASCQGDMGPPGGDAASSGDSAALGDGAAPVYPDGSGLPSQPGDPCPTGECAGDLLCSAGVCHSTCSTTCGDEAPECDPEVGCYVITSFSAVCMPGTGELLDQCGGGSGVVCKAGLLCVRWGGASAKCLKLCKYGCPSGVSCGTTDQGCEICIQ